MLTRAELKSKLSYDPETGIFTWLVSYNGVKVGTVAGCANPFGYMLIKINGRMYMAHRLAWLFVNGSWPKNHIDHINEIKDDNRLSNLREATSSQNQRNRGAQKNNTSGFKGVSFFKRNGKWKSTICVNSNKKHLGYFDNPEEAHQAYCKASDKYHGEFANFGSKGNA